MTTFESCLNVVIWVRGWFSLRAIMFLCTWKPGGRRSSNSCIRLQSIFCRPHNNHYFTVRFDYLLSTVNGRSYPHTVGLVPNYWKLWVVHCSETPLSERKEPSSPPSCHTCWGHEKLFFSAWFMWGQASFGFFLPLWTVMCWHQIGFQMFPEECILLAVVSAVGQHVSQSIPKVALIPATFKSSYSPFVVIGRPELVIYGLFDCWHVKCLVPTPKAELWLAGSFVFSCLTFDLRTSASVKRHSFLGLASLLR